MAEPSRPRSPLVARPHVLVRELGPGAAVALPVAAPMLAGAGDRESALTNLQVLLEEHLAHVPAQELPRFTLSDATELYEVEVSISPRHLPRRLEIDPPVTFSVVWIPSDDGGAWVVVPALGHTFFVSRREDRAEIVPAEIRRVAALHLEEPRAFMELLPRWREALERLEVPISRAERDHPQAAATTKAALARQHRERQAKAVLDSVGIPLHEDARVRGRAELVGRTRELDTLSRSLTGTHRRALLLVGGHLTGKTALVHRFVAAEREAKRPLLVYATSGAQLVAGMSALGQWQERLRRVLEAAGTLDAILYFDDVTDLFGEGTQSQIDLAGAMKPALDDGRVRVIAEVTQEALTALENRHVGFFSCFERLRVEPLGKEAAHEALERRVALDRASEPDRPTLAAGSVEALIALADRYLPYQPFPGKAIRLYDEIRAASERELDPRAATRPIDAERVVSSFSRATGIPELLLREDRALHAAEITERFTARIVGQSEAVRRVVEAVCVVKAQLGPSGKPLATFLFVGPTGVGKTELARALSEILFGSAERMVRFDMSEFTDQLAAERLIRGTDRNEGLLTRQVRQQPFCVVLLDEVEKAHASVFDLLLQVTGEGRLTDARGNTAYFHNAIIIMTSNLGAAHQRKPLGIEAREGSSEAHYLAAVSQAFRPELVNRIDRIITFEALRPDEVRRIADLAIDRVSNRRGFSQLRVRLLVTEGARASLAAHGYSPAYGARALRRHIEDHLVAPAARLLSRAGARAAGATLLASLPGEVPPDSLGGPPIFPMSGAQLSFGLWPDQETKLGGGEDAAETVVALRRDAAALLSLGPIQDLRLRMLQVRTDLSRVTSHPADKKTAREIAELQVEHHHVLELLQPLDTRVEELCQLEALAITATHTGRDASECVPEARASYLAFASHAVPALTSGPRAANELTFTVQELDKGRALDEWLAPLLEASTHRGWVVEAHRPRALDQEGDEAWPRTRPWGPARSAAICEGWLRAPSETPRTFLVRVRGPHAGGLLRLEAGLHELVGVNPKFGLTRFVVRLLASHSNISLAEWETELFDVPASALSSGVDKQKPIRRYDARYEMWTLFGGARLRMDIAQYWPRYEEIALMHLRTELDREVPDDEEDDEP